MKKNDNVEGIDFYKTFILCVLIMIIDQGFTLFENAPELFQGGDEIFHIMQAILSVLTQLSASIAAAIIFYYMCQFVDARNCISDIEDVQVHIENLLFQCMKVYGDDEGKSCCIEDLVNKNYIKSNVILDEKYSLKIKIIQDELNHICEFQQLHIYYKKYKNEIESIKEIFNRLLIANNEIHTNVAQINELMNDFVTGAVEIYKSQCSFVDSINKKRIFTFIKMSK